jgi:predicted transcriptional regulator
MWWEWVWLVWFYDMQCAKNFSCFTCRLTSVNSFVKKMSPMSESGTQTREQGQPGFTYLTNHAHVLVALDADPEARVRDLAATVGITERAVQRIIVDLETVGALERLRSGRRNHYRILRDGRLRHPLEQHCTVGGLLEWIRSVPH